MQGMPLVGHCFHMICYLYHVCKFICIWKKYDMLANRANVVDGNNHRMCGCSLCHCTNTRIHILSPIYMNFHKDQDLELGSLIIKYCVFIYVLLVFPVITTLVICNFTVNIALHNMKIVICVILHILSRSSKASVFAEIISITHDVIKHF